jgi:ADP-ribosylglycohydrolase
LKALEQGESLAGSDLPQVAAISQLGQGWVAEEALAISVYCALVARDFRSGVIMAVNHDGDSDSTGSITGNLLGTMLGVAAIWKDWLTNLELRRVIADVAEDLFRFRDWDFQKDEGRIWRKYPG